MQVIIARTYAGAVDLYHGVPDLEKAEFQGVEYVEDGTKTTVLKFVLESGEDFQLRIAPAE